MFSIFLTANFVNLPICSIMFFFVAVGTLISCFKEMWLFNLSSAVHGVEDVSFTVQFKISLFCHSFLNAKWYSYRRTWEFLHSLKLNQTHLHKFYTWFFFQFRLLFQLTGCLFKSLLKIWIYFFTVINSATDLWHYGFLFVSLYKYDWYSFRSLYTYDMGLKAQCCRKLNKITQFVNSKANIIHFSRLYKSQNYHNFWYSGFTEIFLMIILSWYFVLTKTVGMVFQCVMWMRETNIHVIRPTDPYMAMAYYISCIFVYSVSSNLEIHLH